MQARPTLGVLMLDTRFPRVVGDIGNPSTFPFDVQLRVVRGASARRVVHSRDASLLRPFIDAARALIDEGATAISTSCGFLVLYQEALQAALPVPVWTSSLQWLPELQRMGPTGVVTVDAASLGAEHLRAAHAASDTPVEGLANGCAFQRTLLDDEPSLDMHEARAATVDAASRLVARRPDLVSIVLECTNMPPYADAVRAATGREVHDITTLLMSRLAPSLERQRACE